MMHEVLLQSIVEKLQAIETLLKQDNSDKNEQSFKSIYEEIKKVSASAVSIDKFNELKLSINECCKKVDRPLQQYIEHKHHLHKGLWISLSLFLVTLFFLWQWMNTMNDKKQFHANYIKYRALKVTGNKGLLEVLYHADSLYELDPDKMKNWVLEEENRLLQQLRFHQPADEKKKEVKSSRDKFEMK